MEANNRTFLAYLDEMKVVTILLPLSYHQGKSSFFMIVNGGAKSPLQLIKHTILENHSKYVCGLEQEIHFGKQYWVIDEHGSKTDLQIGAVIRTEEFDDHFYYEGDDLGTVYHPNQTQFKLWAPTAIQVKLKLHHPGAQYAEIIKMKREDKGVWKTVIHRNLEYYHYCFLVLVNQQWQEAIDPYVKAVSVNGEHGVIINLEKTRMERPELPPFENPVDAIIYETHIRDFTSHPSSGAKHKGLYLGAAEQNTMDRTGGLTGLSYLKDLGITHLQLMPFHDFAGVDELEPQKEYNWGYNPLHFNVPEGSYATDPSNPYTRIMELKHLIKEIHHAGLRVIMDVVYNHVYIREDSSFEKIVPGYYFRHNEAGLPSNGTGVGNDIASERKMVRKFIVDSVSFWISEYHIDGLRFDLMGILDVDTMNEIRRVCDGFDQNMLIVGEGWDLDTPLSYDRKASLVNQANMPRIAQFNDSFRDCIKGNTFHLHEKGYVLGNEEYYQTALESITGSIGFLESSSPLFNEPSQSVNFIECHDNHTLWDKFAACLEDQEETVRMKYHRLATGIVILSQGIPFLHSGQEFFRTKQGDGNSYCSPDVINQMDWDRKSVYKDNAEYIKGLIQIRKVYSCFRLRTASDIRKSTVLLPLGIPLLGFHFKKDEQSVLLLINPSSQPRTIRIPEGNWCVLADSEYAGISPIRTMNGEEERLNPISLNVLIQK